MDKEESDIRKCKVIIVGGGMAGLSAATLLAKNNMTDFVLLEARKRIGGRIVSIEPDGCKLELGANWIHGILGNPMYEMALVNNLVDIVHVPKPHKVIAATEDGNQVSSQLLQEIYEAYMCFLRRCEEYFLCQYLPPEGIESVGEHIELEIELYLQKLNDPEERHVRRLIFDCLLKRETCISGCDSMSDIDLLELGSYTELQGGNITLPSGYSSILGPASKHIPPDNILKEHAVACIKWSSGENWYSDLSDDTSDDSERTVIDSEINDRESISEESVDLLKPSIKDKIEYPVEVLCENGNRFLADHVICTIPLGVLKEKSTTLFSPPLPLFKQESIERLSFGTVNKIFLVYERPFLPPDVSEVMFLWEADPQKDDDISKAWQKKIFSFSQVTDTVLLGWISGKEAEYAETLSQDTIAETCTDILRKFLNDPYVPKPKACVCTHWHSEPYTKGSYTAVAVGASQCDIENLALPLYTKRTNKKPTLLFAGEHTHNSFYSTVHGAYLSGRTCAQSLLDPEDEPVTISCTDTGDLSSWIRGISLED